MYCKVVACTSRYILIQCLHKFITIHYCQLELKDKTGNTVGI